ncbi:LacI family DNA-binding transcriptional regulator [Novosphingobium sp. 1949]|uniref:LacI family DNA-binding transcriptional regulator n=1 Tax=Novosphingobium organovorum TaxID=2930092 RepID=A0ABT0BIB2_9SPHN|nr:LacI family DNA-binding transcriptional regulator [Novosphingobium organovorum]MCJ2184791.1 LacI family DNA-binding transcriptional regulator [Novosphingobium organovorum]
MTKSRATMTQVARLAGVSIKSVSRVINREAHISPRLRERVEAAIAELNYTPDTAARSLAGARAFVVGVLFDNPSPNYTMNIVGGAHEACSAQGYHLRIDNLDSTEQDRALADQLEAVLSHGRCDGFVLTPPLTDIPLVLDTLERHDVRFVRIAPVLAPGRTPTVQIDDFAAAGAVAQCLWGMGHRHFGFVGGPPSHGAAGTRRAGFFSRLKALGLEAMPSEASGDFSFDGGIAAGFALLRTATPPTAIFAANDDMAAGVMVAAAQCGLAVPRDLSVFGFDDSWVALSVWPYLSTVHQPIRAMASAAVSLLLDHPREALALEPVTLDWTLIERGSHGPVRPER